MVALSKTFTVQVVAGSRFFFGGGVPDEKHFDQDQKVNQKNDMWLYMCTF